jgi:hypothetical protein
MEGAPIAGIVLVVAGVVALTAGIAGGITKLFVEVRKEILQSRSLANLPIPTELMESLGRFIQTLAGAPIWLALVILGFLMIVWGGSMF